MNWLATKISFGIILAHLLATLCAYSQAAANPMTGVTATALCFIPALLMIDLTRYAVRCWRTDCLAD